MKKSIEKIWEEHIMKGIPLYTLARKYTMGDSQLRYRIEKMLKQRSSKNVKLKQL